MTRLSSERPSDRRISIVAGAAAGIVGSAEKAAVGIGGRLAAVDHDDCA